MDTESPESSHEYSIPLRNPQENRTAVHQSELLETQCMVCRRPFIPWTELNESPDPFPIPICRDCKSLVLDDNETLFSARNSRARQRRRRSTHGSSESVESAFSQQFSQFISSARQNQNLQLDPTHALRNWLRRTRRPNSDTDNDSIDRMDSLFSETDSHISFDSDASIDIHSMIDREIHSPLTDTDIDPMRAGLDQWNSDEQNEYGAWELRLRVRSLDLFADSDEIDLSPFTGNSGDYMDARGFEELLEQLAEADSSRRGAPPAAAASVRNLPRVIISHDHEENGSVVCAICKDSLSVNGEARQLPCSHLYHASCILPWLRSRNSCPVCRYELPTDDPEYEEGKHNRLRNVGDEIRVREGFFDESSDVGEEGDGDDRSGENRSSYSGSNGGGNGRWILIAAAPIVAFVGIVVLKWVRSSMAGVRVYDREQSYGGMARRVNRNGRRWYLF